MKNRIGVGIIGAGNIGDRHARACQVFPQDCEVVGFADVIPGRAEEMASKFGAKGAFTDHHQLLAMPELDLVIVCTPPFAHLQNTLDAFAAGKHVLCEKPMAASPEECDRMIAEAERRGLVLAGSTQHRFSPACRQAKALMDSGEMGRPLIAVVNGLWWRSKEYYDVWWRGTWEQECGGTLLNHHSHFLDLMLYLMGEPAWVQCEMATLNNDIEVEDTAMLQLGFKNGALGSAVASSCDQHGAVTRLDISGEKAAFTLRVGKPLEIFCSRARAGGYNDPDPDAVARLQALVHRLAPPPAYTDHVAVVHDALQSIKNGKPAMINGQELRRSVDLAAAAYQSASLGGRVGLPLTSKDPFYSREGILKSVRRSPRGAGHQHQPIPA